MFKKIDHLFMWARFTTLNLLHSHKIKAAGRNYFEKGSLHITNQGRLSLGKFNGLSRGYDIEVSGKLILGNHNFFNRNVKIVCLDKIEIGNDCIIADSVHIYDHDHRFEDVTRPIRDQGYVTSPIKIGNNVWIGAKATLLKGVSIGDGVIVAAGSVVRSNLPSNTVCGGVPAKVLKQRDPNAKN